MAKHRFIRLGLIAVLTLTLTVPAHAILGIGDIVFDPSVYAQAVQQLVQMEQQYAQLVQSYVMLRNQYQQLMWMAQQVPVDMAARYRAAATLWKPSSATDIYGTTAGWITGINSGQGVSVGYSAATEPLGTYGGALGNIPADQLPRVKSDYGTVELADGTSLAAINTIGRIRGNAPAVETAIQGLENDSLSADPAMNTEIAVLNKINAAHLIEARTSQDTNQLLVALSEQQLIEAKRTRDAEARAINQHIAFMTNGQAVMTAQAAGASQAMLNWQMP